MMNDCINNYIIRMIICIGNIVNLIVVVFYVIVNRKSIYWNIYYKGWN